MLGPSGDLFVTDSNSNTIRRVTPAGLVTTFAGQANASGSADGFGAAARFNSPRGIAVDATGVLYVADAFNSTVRRISPTGDVTTLAGAAGDHGSTDGTGNAARFGAVWGIAVDPSDNIYVSEESGTIRKITPGGVVSHFAGRTDVIGADDGTGANATFYAPQGLAADAAGNVYVADWQNNSIRKITPVGVVSTLAGLSSYKAQGYADGPGSGARFLNPSGVAVDASGNLYVTDGGNHVVRKSLPPASSRPWPARRTQPAVRMAPAARRDSAILRP